MNADNDKYIHHLEELKDEHEKATPLQSRIKKLIKLTFNGRRSWVLKYTPSVAEVIEVFPLL